MKIAIFDMDGTLIDSMGYWRTVAIECLREQGFEPSPELQREIYLMSVRKTPTLMRAHFDIKPSDSELNASFDRLMAAHYARDVRLKPHVAEYLAKLRAAGVVCALATASYRSNVEPLMARLGVRDYFRNGANEYMFCSDELGATKAQDEYYPALCARLHATPDECVLFEDALYSIKTAAKAGLHIWAIEDDTAQLHKAEIIALSEMYFHGWDELL